MKSKLFTSLLLFMLALLAHCQTNNIHGKVMHRGKPLPKANVKEIDINHRVINQTHTDNNGYFTLTVSGGKTSVRVTANGMKKFTHKIGNRTAWEISLEEEEDTGNDKVRSRHETTKLLAGHSQGRIIPQLTWVEHINDSTFCLVIPVRVSNGVEEYPQGRKVVVQDYNGRIIAIGTCLEQAIPEEGMPESYDPYVFSNINNQSDESNDYFCYPRFVFSKTDLEHLIDHSTELACFAVDTAKGDNYWMYYKSTNFAKELQKILNRMLK